MKDIIFDDFQNSVNDSLLRHKSILDVLTKFSESNARVNRAIAKSVTNCGCIEVNAKKQKISEDNIINNLHDSLDDHLNGTLCESCREVIESEIGNNLFYLTSLCNLLNLNLYDILLKESDKINTLGKFTFR
ncbi:DUF1573 domain-containing protein [Clostridium sp. HCP1S3_B4]|uniref:DUF1573 domain-containing protein n=1 Tax=unclassified Clostridium TaxID=2614128 RepID=UPI00169A411B|nr:DUF1573 domain-containing protein [Clostridium sp.]MDD5794636.1 DUF1573 domain-containing protein [Clostridiales bacterium]MDY2729376.1 DUF1573 domain-containing protein [Clostridium sp.]NLK22510.1 DUF1573 domain-containing protein [Clostridiales bacterium]